MRIAIVSPYATVVPHFETELEIAQRHLDQGHEVLFLNCFGGLDNCDFNPTRDLARCHDCIGRRQMGLELLEVKMGCREPDGLSTTLHKQFPPVRKTASRQELRLHFHSVQELKDYFIEDFEIGFAALSSLVSLYRDPEPDLLEHQSMLERFLTAAWQAYRGTQAFLDEHHPDLIYVFNGRFAAMRAVFRAAQSRNVDCLIHERGCDGQHYEVLRNHLPHDIPAIQEVIRQHWEGAKGNLQREQLAETWYLERLQRIEKDWHSFVKDQEYGRLPEGWDYRKKNIALFCSSDDEFVAIGDYWKNGLYPEQSTGIQQIVQDLLPQAHIHFTLRMHPNLKGIEYSAIKSMLGLKCPNLTVVAPEAAVDSYALMKASDCVVTFGSTIGIEAVYWERPSILLGPSFYRDLGGTYQPNCHEETLALLVQDLETQSKEGALMYGYWLQTHGIPYQYFRADGLFDGAFKNQVLYSRPPKKTLITRFKNELRRAGRIFGNQHQKP